MFKEAKNHLKKYNLDNNILEFEKSSASVLEAADVLNCEPKDIAKSLSLLIDGKPIIIVMAGDVKIDNHKYKEEFKIKAKMIAYNETEAYIGHAPGGVCPFGINNNVLVYLDNSLKKNKIVYPACGNNQSAVKLTIEELEQASNYQKWIDVTKKA